MPGEDNPKQETVIQEFHERLPRRWPLLLLYALIALAIAIIVVLGGRAIYRANHKTTTNTTAAKINQSPANQSGASSANKKNSSSGKSSASSSQTATSLPNSGPGQVVGLFVGASLVAAGLHFIVNLRRNSAKS